MVQDHRNISFKNFFLKANFSYFLAIIFIDNSRFFFVYFPTMFLQAKNFQQSSRKVFTFSYVLFWCFSVLFCIWFFYYLIISHIVSLYFLNSNQTSTEKENLLSKRAHKYIRNSDREPSALHDNRTKKNERMKLKASERNGRKTKNKMTYLLP